MLPHTDRRSCSPHHPRFLPVFCPVRGASQQLIFGLMLFQTCVLLMDISATEPAQVTFKLTSESTPWVTRTYASITQVANESANSRLLGGVHFRSANNDGLKLGRLVASKVYDQIQPGQAIVTQQRRAALQSKSSGSSACVTQEKSKAGRRRQF